MQKKCETSMIYINVYINIKGETLKCNIENLPSAKLPSYFHLFIRQRTRHIFFMQVLKDKPGVRGIRLTFESTLWCFRSFQASTLSSRRKPDQLENPQKSHHLAQCHPSFHATAKQEQTSLQHPPTSLAGINHKLILPCWG